MAGGASSLRLVAPDPSVGLLSEPMPGAAVALVRCRRRYGAVRKAWTT